MNLRTSLVRMKTAIVVSLASLSCITAVCCQTVGDRPEDVFERIAELGGRVKSSCSSDGQRVVSVDYSGCDLNDDDIRRIGHIPNLKEIDVSYTKVTGRGLAWLLAGSSIEALWAKSLDLSDADLGFLTGAAQLRRLGLALNSRLSGSGFEGLRCPTLVQLDLSECPVGERGLRHLAKTFPQLRSLYVQTKLSEQACHEIAGIQTLDELVVGSELSDDAQLAALSPLRNLRTLIITDSKITDAGLLAICDLPQLTVLDMEGTRATGHVLERFAHVEELDLGGSLIDEETIRHVALMPHLRELHVGRSPIAGRDLAHLSQCSTLRSLRLCGIDVDVNCLSRISTLTDLELWSCDLRSGALAGVEKMERLDTLTFDGCRVSHDTLPSVAMIPKLHTFVMTRCEGVTDSLLDQVLSLKHITAFKSDLYGLTASTRRTVQDTMKNLTYPVDPYGGTDSSGKE